MKKTGDLGRTLVVMQRTRNRGPRATLFLARAILTQLQNHPELVPDPFLTLAEFEADVEALSAAEVAAESGGPGKHSRRDGCFFKMVADLAFIQAFVQWKADGDPENAAVIAARAGMTTTGKRNRSTPELKARQSKTRVHGIDVWARVTHTRQSHGWQYSIDGGRTWIGVAMTTQAKTTLGPFTPGLGVMIRHRAFDSTGASDWSDPITIIVT